MQTHDSKNIAIGVLSTTAVILLTAVLVVQSRPGPAFADGMTILHGDYSVAVGGLTQDSEDLLYVVDGTQRRLNVYRYDQQRKQVNLAQSLSLDDMRKATTGQAPPARPGQRRP